MKKTLPLSLCLAFSLFAASAFAKTIKLPEDSPVVSVNVPDSWKPEDTEQGITSESPDGEATVMFEIADAKSMDALIDENTNWFKEQKVVIDSRANPSRTSKPLP